MKSTENIQLRQWAEDMAEQRNSGLTQEAWCKVHGIKPGTFRYRCRRVREALHEMATGESRFVPVVAEPHIEEPERFVLYADEKAGNIRIQVGAVDISIGEGVSQDRLKSLMEVVLRAK